MEIHEQPKDKILLVDQNREYEDLPDDMTDEGNEDKFEESDDWTDDLSDGSNGEFHCVILFNHVTILCFIVLYQLYVFIIFLIM